MGLSTGDEDPETLGGKPTLAALKMSAMLKIRR